MHFVDFFLACKGSRHFPSCWSACSTSSPFLSASTCSPAGSKSAYRRLNPKNCKGKARTFPRNCSLGLCWSPRNHPSISWGSQGLVTLEWDRIWLIRRYSARFLSLLALILPRLGLISTQIHPSSSELALSPPQWSTEQVWQQSVHKRGVTAACVRAHWTTRMPSCAASA